MPSEYSWQRIAEEINVSELALLDAITNAYDHYCARVDAKMANWPAFSDATRIALSRVLIDRNEMTPSTYVTCAKCRKHVGVVSASGGVFHCPCGHATPRHPLD
jgi:hypothetical protein